ncbi:MAG: RagB/SusD family nutrient uptake outer membrane protein [Prevotella sp.]|nr:RagB/SusD family nutrient uptake outer membrane protein [Prevotella sp.]
MKKLLIYIMMAAVLSACDSDFLKEYSQDLSRVQTAEDLNELLMGDCILPLGYFTLANSMYQYENPNFWVVHFMGDELQENLQISEDGDYIGSRSLMYPFFTWQQDCFVDKENKSSLESEEASYWSLAYQKLNNCNMVIDAGEDMTCSEEEDETLRQQVLGECYFLRANYYFMLANLYGRPYDPQTADETPCVPIKTSASVEDREFQRSSVAEVYSLILSDLDQAEAYLSGKQNANIYHVGTLAVYIFRSRIHLFLQQWAEAKRYAGLALAENDKLIDLSVWGTSASSFPIDASNEEVVYSNGSTCLGNMLFQSPSTRSSSSDYTPVYSISDHLSGLYSRTDARSWTYITTRADLTKHTYTYHKIDNSTRSFGRYKDVSDVFSLRTAEAYLNMAEAEAQLGNDGEACRWLDALREKRLTSPDHVSLSGADLITFVREERERELCLEGHRWFDLRRYMVDQRYPFTTTIEHTMSWFTTTNNRYNVLAYTRYYRLSPGDDAYTLNIPKTVRDFQLSIGENPRPERLPFDTKVY